MDVFIIFALMETFKHGSLFSGIGGFDLAAEWMGWENLFHCEWNEFGQKVLKYYWPQAESFTDITKSDFTHYANKIDILTGGFPCQPYSTAGKRKGKDDERHLWPEMLRAIREISPRYVVGENVRGLTNWNGGLVFDEVCAELEAIGYQVAPVIIPACGVNAPHRRERIWFVAYANGTEQRNNAGSDNREAEEIRWENESDVSREFCSYGDVADADGRGTQSQQNIRQEISSQERINSDGREWNVTHANSERFIPRIKDDIGKISEAYRFETFCSPADWGKFPTQPPVCRRDDGLSTKLDGITFPKWRNESIKAYGNAIVPQVAYEIFKAIERLEKDFEM